VANIVYEEHYSECGYKDLVTSSVRSVAIQVNLRLACTIPPRVGDNRSHPLNFHIIEEA